MKELNVYQIPLDNFILERIDPNNKIHKKEIKNMRDHQGKKMMFDIKYDLKKIKNHRSVGNSFLIKASEQYVGYTYISGLDVNDRRGISMLVKKELRNKGLGKIILTSISDYLLNNEYADNISVCIKNKNTASINMATKCGFVLDDAITKDTSIYRRKK